MLRTEKREVGGGGMLRPGVQTPVVMKLDDPPGTSRTHSHSLPRRRGPPDPEFHIPLQQAIYHPLLQDPKRYRPRLISRTWLMPFHSRNIFWLHYKPINIKVRNSHSTWCGYRLQSIKWNSRKLTLNLLLNESFVSLWKQSQWIADKQWKYIKINSEIKLTN